MDHEFQDIEDSLKGLRPAKPDAACLDRLLSAVEGRLQKNDLSLAGIESRLAAMHPVAPAPEAFERMLETVSRVPFPVDEKVVLFPGAAKPAAIKQTTRRPWYAAAAAVAVAGAFTALMVDGGRNNSGSVPVADTTKDTPRVVTPSPLASQSGKIVRASTGVQEASDQGVNWDSGKPMRMVRVRYMDKVQVMGEDGKIREVEVPREELLMLPEKID
jgi:hypothetical protein